MGEAYDKLSKNYNISKGKIQKSDNTLRLLDEKIIE